MTPDQVVGHVEAMLAIARRLADEADIGEWGDPDVTKQFWEEMDLATSFLRSAIKVVTG